MPHLNITGLNCAFSELKKGASYALLAPLDNQLLELTRHILINHESPTFLLSEQVELFFEGKDNEFLFTLFEHEVLYPFHLNSNNNISKDLHFSSGIINELKQYEQLESSTVFVHVDSEHLFSLGEQLLGEKLKLYHALSQSKNVTLVFLMSGTYASELRRQLLALNHFFDGLIYVTQEASIRTLEYDYWCHKKGVIAGRSVNLQLHDGLLALVEIEQEANEKLRPTEQNFDEDEVWLTRSAVPEGTKLPVFYKIVDDNDA
ncbi:BcsE family c-di-GMP-binding protein, partial [Pseudoalteromonas sp. 0303]